MAHPLVRLNRVQHCNGWLFPAFHETVTVGGSIRDAKKKAIQ